VPAPADLTDGLGRRLFRNLTMQSGLQVLMLAFSVVTNKVLSIHLGKIEFGGFLYLFTFLYFFQTLNDLGINTVLIREIAKDPDQTSDLVRKMLGLKILMAVTAVCAGWVTAWYLPLPADLRRAIDVFLLVLPVQAMMLPLVALQGRLMVGRALLAEAANRSTGFALMMLAVFLGRGLMGITIALIGGELAGLAGILIATRRFTLPSPIFDPRVWRDVLRASVPLAAAGALVSIVNRLDAMMLQAMVKDPSQVTFYLGAYRITGMIERLPQLAMATIYPAMAHLSSTDPLELRQLYRRTQRTFLLMGLPIVVAVTWLAPLIVRVQFTPAMAPTAGLLRVIIWATGFLYVAITGGTLLVATGHQRANLHVWLVAAPVNLALNLILIPRYGAFGAAWATVVAFFIVMVGQLILVERILEAMHLKSTMRSEALPSQVS
jgi:O-antigen/teichoic acid export membrane protein